MKNKAPIIGMALIVIAAMIYFYPSSNNINENGSLTENNEIQINKDCYFTYNFSKKPKIGTVVLKINIKNNSNNKIKIIGNYGMPSMPGSHDSGNMEFYVNNNGDYLLPINIAMPGKWRINLTFKNNNEEIFKGDIYLNI